MTNYSKAFAAVVATVISALIVTLSDGSVTNVEWVNVAIAATAALAVFAAPNVPGAKYTKSVLAVALAVLTFFTSAITDGVSTTEWLQVAVIALGALGVYAVPNGSSE